MAVQNKKILITGGGSGGHLSVVSGLIDGIREKYPEEFKGLLYVGGDLGMVGEKFGNSIEQKRFKDADFRCKYIRAGKLQRHFSFNSIKLAFRTLLGLIDSLRIIKSEKPDLIFSSGGFVTVPVCIAGWLKKIPIYLHEQTATIGLSNQIVAKLAQKIFVTFESSKEYFKKREVLITGNIVRESVFNKKGSEEIVDVINKMKNNSLPILYVSGGGLGSHTMNTLILENIVELTRNFNIILQMGDNEILKDYDYAIEKKNTIENPNRFYPTKYIDEEDIGFLYHNIDIYLGRAGANTVYEIGLLKIPSIFIPIPWVRNNEQEKNAMNLVEVGLSKIISEDALNIIDIVEFLKNFSSKNHKIDEKKLNKLFTPNGLDTILGEIFK